MTRSHSSQWVRARGPLLIARHISAIASAESKRTSAPSKTSAAPRAKLPRKMEGSAAVATVVAEPPVSGPLSRRAHEHLFFWGMSIAIALVVFIGFARTYFLA